MTTQPPEPSPRPALSGDVRASHDDREAVVERLRDAAAEGRIDLDELDTRLEQALKSKTYAELAVVTADLPRPRSSESQPPLVLTREQALRDHVLDGVSNERDAADLCDRKHPGATHLAVLRGPNGERIEPKIGGMRPGVRATLWADPIGGGIVRKEIAVADDGVVAVPEESWPELAVWLRAPATQGTAR